MRLIQWHPARKNSNLTSAKNILNKSETQINHFLEIKISIVLNIVFDMYRSIIHTLNFVFRHCNLMQHGSK